MRKLFFVIIICLCMMQSGYGQDITLTIRSVPESYIFLNGLYKDYCPFPGEREINNPDSGSHHLTFYGLGGAKLKHDVVDVVIARGVNPALDKEAVRVVRSSPK